MKYTYTAYKEMIKSLKEKNYQFCSYYNYENDLSSSGEGKVVILRHDIDISITKAVDLAKIENDEGVSATYFVMLTSDFYNVFSLDSLNKLKNIIELGGIIGLHFDETCYPNILGNPILVTEKILHEASVLGELLETNIDTVSYHCPSKEILDSDLEIPGMVNSYYHTFFKEFKYLSDSMHRWREPVLEIIQEGQYDRLHILTHPIWYEDEDIGLKESVNKIFVRSEKEMWYNLKKAIIPDLDKIREKNE